MTSVSRAGSPRQEILIVDDDRDFILELVDALSALNIKPKYAFTAENAYNILVQHTNIRVLITDLSLPRLSGLELARKINTRGTQPVATIVMTGYPSTESAVAALRLSAIDYLHKPLDVHEIANAIDRADKYLGIGDYVSTAAEESSHSYVKILRNFVVLRNEKARSLSPDLFHDPCWNMLIDLALAAEEGKSVSITSLCLASGVSTTTALRRIDDMIEAGLMRRSPDRSDKRRQVMTLTPEGAEKVKSVVVNFIQRHADATS